MQYIGRQLNVVGDPTGIQNVVTFRATNRWFCLYLDKKGVTANRERQCNTIQLVTSLIRSRLLESAPDQPQSSGSGLRMRLMYSLARSAEWSFPIRKGNSMKYSIVHLMMCACSEAPLAQERGRLSRTADKFTCSTLLEPPSYWLHLTHSCKGTLAS